MIASLLGAITFDPTIRGILVVLVGVVVLMGSVYLLLATNTGSRTGFLIAGSALFGWCFLMGSIWWIYGIGLKGRDPAWVPLEINFERGTPLATDLPTNPPKPDSLPDPVETLQKFPLVWASAVATDGPEFKPSGLGTLIGLANPLVLAGRDDAESMIRTLGDDKFEEFLAGQPEIKAAIAQPPAQVLADMRSQARTMRSELEDHLDGWCLLAESDPRRGETVAASDAALAAQKIFGETTTSANYIQGDVFFYGGKDGCTPNQERSTIGQALHRVATTVEIKNPPLFSVVNVVMAKPQVTVEGQAPPKPVVQPGASTISVVMERNLGNKRFPPFVFTLATGILFGLFAWQLHHKDKLMIAARAEFAASGS